MLRCLPWLTTHPPTLALRGRATAASTGEARGLSAFSRSAALPSVPTSSEEMDAIRFITACIYHTQTKLFH